MASQQVNTVGGGDVVVHGLREVTLNLAQFSEKLQRKALANAMRAGGRIVRDVARSRVPVKSGALRRSIRVTIVRRGNSLTARIIAGRRKGPNDPFYAWFVEGGTKAHEIRPKGKKSLFLAGLFKEQVNHPGAEAAPFLGPALEQAAHAALEVTAAVLAAEIEKMGEAAYL